MRKIAVILSLLATQACAADQSAYNAAVNACLAAYPAFVGGMVVRETCLNNASLPMPGYAWGLLRSERLAMAQRVDSGQESLTDGNAQIDRLIYDIQNSAQQQNAAAEAERTQALLNYSAQLLSRPQYAPVYHTQTCNRFGNPAVITCSGF
jgi:hypothetical protein